MELKQSDTINKYDKEMKSQEEIKHFSGISVTFFIKMHRNYTKKMLKEGRIIKGET